MVHIFVGYLMYHPLISKTVSSIGPLSMWRCLACHCLIPIDDIFAPRFRFFWQCCDAVQFTSFISKSPCIRINLYQRRYIDLRRPTFHLKSLWCCRILVMQWVSVGQHERNLLCMSYSFSSFFNVVVRNHISLAAAVDETVGQVTLIRSRKCLFLWPPRLGRSKWIRWRELSGGVRMQTKLLAPQSQTQNIGVFACMIFDKKMIVMVIGGLAITMTCSS